MISQYLSNRLKPASAIISLLLGLLLLTGAAWAQPGSTGWGGAYEIYQVQAGDTVDNIAARFGVAPQMIRTLNVVPDGSALPAGQDLAIPLPAAKPQPATARMLPPRYATTTSVAPIRSEVDGGNVLYRPPAGSRIIVKVERGDYWGVVMMDGSIGWIEKSALEVSDQTLSPEQIESMLKGRDGGRPDVVQEAARYSGMRYRYGGNIVNGIDCSLLVQTAFASRGMSLPRTAAAQFGVGRSVNINELQPGDRLYFINRSGRIGHTGIYVGNGQFIHASSRRGCVAIDSLSDSYYWRHFAGARRS